MTEILLKCPKCGTEYHLPASAIPPDGREVECSACNNNWLALAVERSEEIPAVPHFADQVTAAEQDSDVVRHEPSHSRAVSGGETEVIPGDIPPLRRRLPDNVLKILREEVEFERRARLREKTEPQADIEDNADLWPAMTITEPLGPQDQPAQQELSPKNQETPAKIPLQEAVIIAPVSPPEDRASPANIAPTEITEPAKKPRSGYAAGFGIALIAAAIALAMYLIPVAKTGPLAENLSQYQEHVDTGRNWLQQRVSSLQRN